MQGNSSPSIRALLDKHAPADSPKPPAPASEAADDGQYQPYANGRVGTRAQLTLTFRKADGSIKSFSYSYLYAIESEDPALGFLLELGRAKVLVRGHNLEPLYRLVCLHRVQEITEAPRSQAFEAEKSAPLVQNIEFQKA